MHCRVIYNYLWGNLANCLTFIFLVLSVAVVEGQDIVLKFNRLNTGNGLSSTQFNWYVHQDNDQLIWISSLAGVNVFDGQGVRHYQANVEDEHALLDPFASLSDYVLEENGNIWFCNGKCLIEYERNANHFNRHWLLDENGDTLKNGYTWNYLDRRSNDFWIGVEDQVFVTDINTLSNTDKVFDFNVVIKSKMFGTSDGGNIFLRIGSGVPFLELYKIKNRKIDKAASKFIYTTDSAVVNTVLTISDTMFWVATDLGIRKLNVISEVWQDYNKELANYGVTKITQLSTLNDSTLLLGTPDEGVFLFNTDKNIVKGQLLDYDDGNPKPFKPVLERLYVDGDGNIWFSTGEAELYYTNPNKPKFKSHGLGGKTEYNGFTFVAKSQREGFWATYKQGVALFSGDTIQKYDLPISGEEIEKTTFVLEDSQERVWVGTLEWLFMKEKGEDAFTEMDLLPEALPNLPGYNCMQELPSGELLIGTNDTLLLLVSGSLDEKKWILPELERPFNLLVSGNQAIVCTVYGELAIINRISDNWDVDTILSGFPQITGFSHDSSQNFYWCSSFDGLYRLQKIKNSWSIKRDVNLAQPSLQSMSIDDEGILWFGTPEGILRYDPINFSTNKYQRSDGLQGLDFAFKAACVLVDGSLVFGGTNGLNTFHPNEVASRIPRARPTISEMIIGGRADWLARFSKNGSANPALIDCIELPYTHNSISLRLAAREYSEPDKCQFSYRLLGSNSEETIMLGRNAALQLPGLSPGKYILEVNATNADGIWSNMPHQLAITVFPPLYQSIWAYLIYALTVFTVFFLLYKARLKVITRQEALKTAVAEAAAHSAGVEKLVAKAQAQAAKTETSVLRLQMNPHFIFNSLNAVNAFLWKGNKLEANEYLARFALLMRETLNRSTQTLSRLEDTIYSLENYLGTEQMRLGDKLSYKFEVDETLDTFSVYFPTMMLQPFVENAIWHGISGMAEQGLITIRFQANRDRGVLVAEVEDNGRGRKQAAKRNTGHASKSLGITQRRLDLLNMAISNATETSTAPAPRRPENSNQESPPAGTGTNLIAEMQIIDLIQEDGSEGGTLVRLTLPLKYPKTYARDNS